MAVIVMAVIVVALPLEEGAMNRCPFRDRRESDGLKARRAAPGRD